jgi:hypothetical protein
VPASKTESHFGSVNTSAIYEMKDSSSLSELIEIAGDLNTVADSSKITVDRFVDHQARKTLEFPYDEQSRTMPLMDGDIVRVFPSFLVSRTRSPCAVMLPIQDGILGKQGCG